MDNDRGLSGINIDKGQVPASIHRVQSLAHPDRPSFGLTIAAGLVLPLMGFWNSVIYLVISHEAVRNLFTRYVKHPLGLHSPPAHHEGDDMGKANVLTSVGGSNRELNFIDGKGQGSLSESTPGLATNASMNASMV